jgi:hypothetical protein
MTSTDLEDRLRRDLAAEAARTQASMLRPLTEPERMTRRTLAGWRAPRGAWRWLAPAAAVVAVAAVAAGVMVAGSGQRGRPHAAATPGTALGFPRFYLSVKPGPHARMVIHNSATGRVLSSEPLPGLPGAPLIAASANDRRFAIAVRLHQAHGPVYVGLYTLIISRNGRPEALSSDGKLVLARNDDVVTGIALSPDGRKLAVAEQVPGRSQGEIKVFEGVRLTGIWRGGRGATGDPAWLAGGRYLGFLWFGQQRGEGGQRAFPTRERLLDTAAPGHDLLASSKVISAVPPGGKADTALLSADGRTLLGTWFRNIPGSHGRGVAVVDFGRVGLYGERSVVIEHWVIRYRGPAQENAADLSCRVLSVAGADPAALLRCPFPDPFHDGDRVVLERFQGNYFAMLPSAGASPVVAW